jgi:hypothetical protein
MAEVKTDASATAWNVTNVPARDIPVPPLICCGGMGAARCLGDSLALAASTRWRVVWRFFPS